MKPEFKIEGREATPTEYAELIHTLLASQATTPTARACADPKIASTSMLEALLEAAAGAAESAGAPTADDGKRAVYPLGSGFLEGDKTISSVSAASAKAAPGRYE